MKKILISCFIYFLICLNAFGIEDSGNIYNLNTCIKYALANSPILKKAEYNYEISKKDVNIAKAGYFPATGLNVGYYQSINSNKNYDEAYSKRSLPEIGVYAQQLIYDFGKTNAAINIGKYYKMVAEYEYIDTVCTIINDVKKAYYGALRAKAILEVEKNNFDISRQILNITQKLYEDKKKTETDCISAEVYVSDAEIRLETAKNEYANAIEDLCNLLYIKGLSDIEIKYTDGFIYSDSSLTPDLTKYSNNERKDNSIFLSPKIPEIDFGINDAVKSAYENSPDIKVLNNIVNAMKQELLYSKRNYYPELKGNIGYGRNNVYMSQNNPDIHNNNLNISVNLETSTNIMQTKNEIDKAAFKVKSAESDIDLYKQNVFYEIRKNYNNIKTAQKQIIKTREKILRTKKSFETVCMEYISDEYDTSGYSEVQGARIEYIDAKTEYINQLYNYNTALADLEKISHIHKHSEEEYDLHEIRGDQKNNNDHEHHRELL